MWDLANVRGFLDTVQVTDEGGVSGMGDAIARVLDRYPWLREDPTVSATPHASGPKVPGPKRRTSMPPGPSASSMRERFPALKKGGR